jgi:hypothetical protein
LVFKNIKDDLRYVVVISKPYFSPLHMDGNRLALDKQKLLEKNHM